MAIWASLAPPADSGLSAGNTHASNGGESITSDDHAGFSAREPFPLEGPATVRDATSMTKTIAHRYAKRAAARRRAIRRRAAAWKRQARRAVTLMLVAGGMLGGSAGIAQAQTGGMGMAGGLGQAAMAPTGGLVNRAVTRLQDLEANGPGWLYYGINAADRGLGYNGSYMTLGGYIPYAEDDLGGLWAADLRGHFSEYGGFFSNVGAVRKQFIGGTLLGVGVYWDYDGDQNQYELRGIPCGTSQFGQFGHSYNQVGVSGEWLTDYGNLRSNGYIPVGTTAYTAGAPGSPFYQNFVMAQYGLDAALSGADLEVGAYVPGLSDWAGMVSVGGYALGNDRYNWYSGTKNNQDVVPWFGGVYTRLDMTFVKNWDFSLQANNDSYFDWTGFARLTYRMGGSRRRNVPDQMEQRMMRNEHIVRAHQTPIVAENPSTGTPWRVIHVDNAAVAGGNGTAESPFNTLAAGNAAATNPFDIVFVNRGVGAYDTQSPAPGPANTTFSFQAANQYLVGNGRAFYLPTSCSGDINIATDMSGLLPVLTNPAGPALLVDGAVAPGAVIANLGIRESRVGIQATGNLSSGIARPGGVPFGSATGDMVVSNVTIDRSTPPTAGLAKGVLIDNASGAARFVDTSIINMNDVGFEVLGGTADISYQGSITNDSTAGGSNSAPLVHIDGPTAGTISLAYGNSTGTVVNKLSDTGGGGILIENQVGGTVNLGNIALSKINSSAGAITLDNNAGAVNIQKASIVNSGTVASPSPFGISIQNGSTGTFSFFDTTIAEVGSAGVNLDASPTASATFDNLVITQTSGTTGGRGVVANGFGTLSFTGLANSITTQNAAAFDLNSVSVIDAGTSPAPGSSPFVKVSTQTAVGGGGAVILTGGASSGILNLGSNFTVAGGVAGTAADVNNTTAGPGVTVIP